MGRRRDITSQRSEVEELRRALYTARLSRDPGSHLVAVVGPKGGSGKTTTAAMLATTLAEVRGEIVCVLDATNQLGTLRRRLVAPTEPATLSLHELCARALAGELAPEWSALAPYVDVVGGLRVLRSLSSADGRTLGAEEFAAGLMLLRRVGQIVVADVGTKANGAVLAAALTHADTLVIATELAYDALELTIEMVSALAGEPLSYRPDPDDWSALSDGGFGSLVQGAIVVVSPGRYPVESGDHVDGNLAAMLEWLRVVCGGGVVRVGYDEHLGAGDVIDPSSLSHATVSAHLRVAGAVAARFSLEAT